MKNNITTVAILSGIAVGALFMMINRKKIGKSLANLSDGLFVNLKRNKTRKAQEKLGSLIEDVRFHVKQNAAGLIGGKVREIG